MYWLIGIGQSTTYIALAVYSGVSNLDLRYLQSLAIFVASVEHIQSMDLAIRRM